MGCGRCGAFCGIESLSERQLAKMCDEAPRRTTRPVSIVSAPIGLNGSSSANKANASTQLSLSHVSQRLTPGRQLLEHRRRENARRTVACHHPFAAVTQRPEPPQVGRAE